MDKIICVGKNYLDHAKELGDAVPEKPVLFLKPPSCVARVERIGERLRCELPRNRGEVHHECEIVLRLGADLVPDAVGLGLDLTLRELQSELKKKGHPWEKAKVFAGSAVLGPWLPIREAVEYLDWEFEFRVGGAIRQRSKGREMRMLPDECVAYAAEFFPLRPGDVVFTGTPAGVGPLSPGQESELRWAGKTLFFVDWH